MLRLSAVILVSLVVPRTASADCAMVGLEAKVIARPNVEVWPDGGVVVMAAPKIGGKLEQGDAAIDRRWRFKGSDAEPTFVSIAPGLAVIRPPKDASGRAIGGELVHGTTSLYTVKLAAKKLPPLAAPVVKSIEHQEHISRRVSVRVTVKLDTIPAGAVALVLADAAGRPRSFGTIGITDPSLGVAAPPAGAVWAYAQRDCIALPNGTVPSRAGDTVTVMFVDATGRVSPPSKPFKIVPAPRP
jgi:hypothetical protein